jgi:hypothetical protein
MLRKVIEALSPASLLVLAGVKCYVMINIYMLHQFSYIYTSLSCRSKIQRMGYLLRVTSEAQ